MAWAKRAGWDPTHLSGSFSCLGQDMAQWERCRTSRGSPATQKPLPTWARTRSPDPWLWNSLDPENQNPLPATPRRRNVNTTPPTKDNRPRSTWSPAESNFDLEVTRARGLVLHTRGEVRVGRVRRGCSPLHISLQMCLHCTLDIWRNINSPGTDVWVSPGRLRHSEGSWWAWFTLPHGNIFQ